MSSFAAGSRCFRALLPALCLCLAACLPVGRTASPSVYGLVRDAATGAPVAGVSLTAPCRKDSVSAVSDAQGHFQWPGKNFVETTFAFQEAPPLSVCVRASRNGYFTYTQDESLPRGGAKPDVHINVLVYLMPETHPVAPYAKALRDAVPEDFPVVLVDRTFPDSTFSSLIISSHRAVYQGVTAMMAINAST